MTHEDARVEYFRTTIRKAMALAKDGKAARLNDKTNGQRRYRLMEIEHLLASVLDDKGSK